MPGSRVKASVTLLPLRVLINKGKLWASQEGAPGPNPLLFWDGSHCVVQAGIICVPLHSQQPCLRLPSTGRASLCQHTWPRSKSWWYPLPRWRPLEASVSFAYKRGCAPSGEISWGGHKLKLLNESSGLLKLLAQELIRSEVLRRHKKEAGGLARWHKR